MGGAKALQPSLEQRGFLGFLGPEGVLVRGVLVLDSEAGVTVPDGLAGSSALDCMGEADRRAGGSSCSVDDSCNLRSATVLEASRGLPSMMSLTSVGRVQEADRNSRMLETVWIGLMFNLMVLPSHMLTLMEMLSEDSSLLEVLEATDPDLERMLKVLRQA